MIKINEKEIYSVLNAEKDIEKIMKGTLTVYEGFKNLIASGVPPLALVGSKGKNLVDYKLYGESVQETQTTPDTPVEVESVGEYDETTGKYKIPVIARGKNILNIDDLLNAPSGTINGYEVTNLLVLNVKPNTKYTMSSDGYGSLGGTADTSRCLYFHGTSTDCVVFKDNPVTITTSDAGILKIVLMGNRSIAKPIKNKEVNIQIEEGDTVTEYEPYNGFRTEIMLDQPLRKFKDYVDYIDFKNKKVVRPISERILTGSESSGAVTTGCYVMYLKGYIYGTNVHGFDAGYMNYFPNNNSYGNVYKGTVLGFYFTGSQLRIGYPEKTNKNDFIAWVKEKYNEGKPVKVYGVLATPTEEDIELPNIPTIKGDCILSVDTSIQPTNIEVIYKGKLETLDTETNDILNSIIASTSSTKVDMTDIEINKILDEIIGG